MTQAFNLSQLANKVDTSGNLDASIGLTGVAPIANGGTNNGSLAVTNGGVLYTDGAKVVNLGVGSSGQVVQSQGAGLPPIWGSSAGGNGGATETTSSSNITLTNVSNRVQAISMTTTGLVVTLPDATTISQAGSPIFVIENTGGNTFAVQCASGGIIAYCVGGAVLTFTLSNKTNANTGWSCSGSLNQVAKTMRYASSNFVTGAAYTTGLQVAQLSSSAYLFVYYTTYSSGSIVAAVVGTLSGTTMTFGSPVTTTLTNYRNGYGLNSSLIALSSTTAMLVWEASDGTNTYTYAVGISVSGTTPTWGTSSGALSSWASAATLNTMSAVKLDSTHVYYVYSASGSQLSGRVLTYNGASAPTGGTAVAVSTANYDDGIKPIVALVTTNKVIAYYFSGANIICARVSTISGTTITQGTELVSSITTWSNPIFYLAYCYSATEAAFLSNQGYAVFSISGTTITLTTNSKSVIASGNSPVALSSTEFMNTNYVYTYTSGSGFSYKFPVNPMNGFDGLTLNNLNAPFSSTGILTLGYISNTQNSVYVLAEVV